MITAYGSVGQAVEAIKAGAFDYIEKPFEQDADPHRSSTRRSARRPRTGSRRSRTLYRPSEPEQRGKFGLVGDSPRDAARSSRVIEKVADTPSTVLITGESRHRQGAGRQGAARALEPQGRAVHQDQLRRDPQDADGVASCSATRRARSPARPSSKPGRFELADGGTLFLDEIGEIPVEMQVKLLRAIQESEFERVGGIKTIKVDVRLITATNRDLEQEIQRGNFREDLFYRLNVVPLQIPPLRKRTGDIPLLVQHIIKKFNERLKKNDHRHLRRGARRARGATRWPGNIRELENVLERTILFCKGDRIERADLPARAARRRDPSRRATTPSGRWRRRRRRADDDDARRAAGPSGSLKDIVRAETSRVERELIVKALDETGGNVTQAAQAAQDQPQEPADEDEGVRPARPRRLATARYALPRDTLQAACCDRVRASCGARAVGARTRARARSCPAAGSRRAERAGLASKSGRCLSPSSTTRTSSTSATIVPRARRRPGARSARRHADGQRPRVQAVPPRADAAARARRVPRHVRLRVALPIVIAAGARAARSTSGVDRAELVDGRRRAAAGGRLRRARSGHADARRPDVPRPDPPRPRPGPPRARHRAHEPAQGRHQADLEDRRARSGSRSARS